MSSKLEIMLPVEALIIRDNKISVTYRFNKHATVPQLILYGLCVSCPYDKSVKGLFDTRADKVNGKGSFSLILPESFSERIKEHYQAWEDNPGSILLNNEYYSLDIDYERIAFDKDSDAFLVAGFLTYTDKMNNLKLQMYCPLNFDRD